MPPRLTGFILAAGEGKRLRPATCYRPKPLLPFCGVSLLAHAVSHLARLPLQRIVINACHLPGQIADALPALQRLTDIPLFLSVEETLLGTGGGLRHALPLLDDADAILIHNADVILDADLAPFLEEHLRHKPLATMLLTPGGEPCTVQAEDGRVVTFRRKPGEGAYTFTGIHLLSREALDYLAPDDPACIAMAYERAIHAGQAIRAVSAGDAFWSDLGTTESYLRAHADVMAAGISHLPLLQEAIREQRRRRSALETRDIACSGALGLGCHIAIPPGSRLHDVVVLDGAVLPDAGCYAHGILGLPRAMHSPSPKRLPHPDIFAAADIDPAAVTLHPLREQGSNRRYCRLQAGERTWVWCAYAPEPAENQQFAAIAAFLLRRGLHVPRVLCHLPELGEILCEDLGSRDVLSIADPVQREACLRQALEQIALLHTSGEAALCELLPLQPPYDEERYLWEREYFRTQMLDNYLEASELWTEQVEIDYRRLLARLLSEPPVLIHRDFQSANLMARDDGVYLIDFQGMRFGCAAYDLASLLYDPYAGYSQEMRDALYQHYCRVMAGLGMTYPTGDVLTCAVIQRMFQALGAYGKLCLEGKEWFRRHIPAAVRILHEASVTADLPGISTLAEKAGRLVSCELLPPIGV